MVRQLEQLDENNVAVRVECREPNGTFVRTVRFVPFSVERLHYYYEKLKRFDVLFNDLFRNDFDVFVRAFVGNDGEKTWAKGLLWEVDDVGIVYLTDIKPGYEATAHINFWDRRLKGREELCRELAKHVFLKLKLHRLVAEIPLYSLPTINMVEKVGFKKEGRKRKAARYKQEWWDVNMYSMLETDLLGGLEQWGSSNPQ